MNEWSEKGFAVDQQLASKLMVLDDVSQTRFHLRFSLNLSLETHLIMSSQPVNGDIYCSSPRSHHNSNFSQVN